MKITKDDLKQQCQRLNQVFPRLCTPNGGRVPFHCVYDEKQGIILRYQNGGLSVFIPNLGKNDWEFWSRIESVINALDMVHRAQYGYSVFSIT